MTDPDEFRRLTALERSKMNRRIIINFCPPELYILAIRAAKHESILDLQAGVILRFEDGSTFHVRNTETSTIVDYCPSQP